MYVATARYTGACCLGTRLQSRGLSTAVEDELLDLAYGSTVDIPHLLLVGDCDPLADREAIELAAKALPSARLSVVRDAHHDVLNDLQHRSVAAEVVTSSRSCATTSPRSSAPNSAAGEGRVVPYSPLPRHAPA